MARRAGVSWSNLALAMLWLGVTAVAAFFAWSSPPVPDAKDGIARLLKASSAVSYRSDEFLVWSTVSKNQAFVDGDHLATGEGGSATVVLEDSRRLVLGPNSYLIFEKIDRSRPDSLEVTLLRGALQASARPKLQSPKASLQLSVRTESKVMKLGGPDSRLKVAVNPGDPDVVTESVQVASTVRAVTVKKAPKTTPSRPLVAIQTAETSPTPPPADKSAKAPNAKDFPRLTLELKGSVIWMASGSTFGMEVPLSLSASGPVPGGFTTGLEVKDGTGRVLKSISLRLKNNQIQTSVPLSALAGQAHQLPNRLSFSPVFVAKTKDNKATMPAPAKEKWMDVRVIAAGDARVYSVFQTELGGVARRAKLFLSNSGGSRSGKRLDFFGSSALIAALPWLVGSGNSVLEVGASPDRGEALFLLKNGALVGKARDARVWTGSAQRLARILGASLVIATTEDALGGKRSFRYSLAELKSLVTSHQGLRLFFVVDGKVQSFNPALLQYDQATLTQLAERGVGPFTRKIAIVHSSAGGVGH